MSSVSPSPAADAFAANSRASIASAPLRPADVTTNRASASSWGAVAVDPASSNTDAFMPSTSSADRPTRPTIFDIDASKFDAILTDAAPTPISGNVTPAVATTPAFCIEAPSCAMLRPPSDSSFFVADWASPIAF